MLLQKHFMDALAAKATELRVLEFSDMYDLAAPVFENIYSLQHLTRLDLSLCDLWRELLYPVEGLCSRLAQLSRLKHLVMELRGATNVHLPPDFSQLQALTHLALSGLADCSRALSPLTRLKDLRLEYFEDTLHVPSDLNGLQNLTCLRFGGSHVRLGGHADQLSRLIGMRHLVLEDCMELGLSTAAFSSALRGLKELQYFGAMWLDAQIDVTALYPMYGLSALTKLELAHVGLHNFTCSDAWQNLQHLLLRQNLLQCLPAKLTCLSALVHLDVSFQLDTFQLAGPLDCWKFMPGLCIINLQQRPCRPVTHGCDNIAYWSEMSARFLSDAREQTGAATSSNIAIIS